MVPEKPDFVHIKAEVRKWGSGKAQGLRVGRVFQVDGMDKFFYYTT